MEIVKTIGMVTRYAETTRHTPWPFDYAKAEAVHNQARARAPAIRGQSDGRSSIF